MGSNKGTPGVLGCVSPDGCRISHMYLQTHGLTWGRLLLAPGGFQSPVSHTCTGARLPPVAAPSLSSALPPIPRPSAAFLPCHFISCPCSQCSLLSLLCQNHPSSLRLFF